MTSARLCRWIWTPYGIRRSLDTRHQLTFTFTTLLSVIALITVVVPTVMLRNDFSKVVKALPALDGNLSARLGDNFKQLVSGIGVQRGICIDKATEQRSCAFF